MKPSLEQLKSQRECDRQFAEYHQRTADERRRAVSDLDAQIAAEEEREAKAKEWPQEGDQCWLPGLFSTTTQETWKPEARMKTMLAMGLVQRTQSECEVICDFLRSRPRGWLLAMAKLGDPERIECYRAGAPCANSKYVARWWTVDKWNALTDDERAALLGQG